MIETNDPPVKAPRRLRWFQLSLRGFLLLVLAFCVWLGVAVQRARRQEDLVRKITANPRNLVTYAHEINADGTRPASVTPPGPTWLRRQIGDHFFFRPRMLSLLEYDDALLREAVQLPGIEIVNLADANDERLTQLRNVANLRMLDASSPYISKKGLAELARHTQLEYLSVHGAWVTDEDLKLLAPVKNLRNLNVAYSQVTSLGVDWAMKTWPQLAINTTGFAQGPDAACIREHLASINARCDATNGEVTGMHLFGQETTDAELLTLPMFPKLQMIFLEDTSVTAEGVRALQRLRPDISVRPNLLGPAAEEAALVAELEGLGVKVRLDDDGYAAALTASQSELEDEEFALLAKATKLRSIYCDSPNLSDRALESLTACDRLMDLSLPNAAITDAGLQHLQPKRRLHSVVLGGTGITDAGLAALANKPQLNRLTLTKITISAGGLQHLATCPRLERLDLSGAQLSPGSLDYLAQAASLESLTLDGATVTDAELEFLGTLRQLKSLSLVDTPVTDAGLQRLHRLGALRSLQLKGAPVTKEAVEAFKTSVPTCNVLQ